MSLATPAKVQKLQVALHAKAKGSLDYRFDALYDKVYRVDVLAYAYDCCKANGGVAGVDGQTFEDIESCGRTRWLGELAREPAAPVAAQETQAEGSGDFTLPRRVPPRPVGSGMPSVADAQPPVGEGVRPCPRAGCGKPACPVR